MKELEGTILKPGEVEITTTVSGRYFAMKMVHMPTGIVVKEISRSSRIKTRKRLLKELDKKVRKHYDMP